VITLLCIVLFIAGFGIGSLVVWSRRGAMDERLKPPTTPGSWAN
jgi:hypothetical protein